MKPVGVVLSGCGFLDGAEIYESVLTLLALDRSDVPYQCLAPDIEQYHVINHLTGQPTTEKRNVLVEAARIARGKIEPLSDAWLGKISAVIFPGGFGAAKNYCDYAVKGDNCSMNPIMESFMTKAADRKLPIGVICISPLVLARALKGRKLHPKLTVGAVSSASASVETFGAQHVVCPVNEFVVDKENRIVSTPAFMYNARIREAAEGIGKLIGAVIEMAEEFSGAAVR